MAISMEVEHKYLLMETGIMALMQMVSHKVRALIPGIMEPFIKVSLKMV